MPALRSSVLALAVLTACALVGCTRAPAAQPASPQLATQSAASTSHAVAPVSPRPTPSRPAAHPTVPTSAARAVSTAIRVRPVSASARAAGLIDVRTIVPDAVIDLRYATSDNFVGVQLYPTDARCLVHESMAAGLAAAAAQLRRRGDVLVFWDCYRPHAVQVHMFQIVPDANWVARPGPFATSHEAARSVDVTLAHASTSWNCAAAQRVQRHCLLEMGTGFDDFTARAHAFASYGVDDQAQTNRALLRAAMNAGAITVYSGEWWHFDGPGALVARPQLDVPVD